MARDGRGGERARGGNGPTLLEANTFRFKGHYFGDPEAYIPKAEYEAAMARDPMPICRAAVLATGAATRRNSSTLAAEIDADIDDALKFAADSPLPDLSEIDTDIYGVGARA